MGLWYDPAGIFLRAPYVASFRAGKFDFTLVSVHSTYGDQSRQRAETLSLDDVYKAIQDADPHEQDVILLGDFNLPPEDDAWAEIRDASLVPVFEGKTRTMISDRSLYDNMWWDPTYVVEWTGKSGVDRFDDCVFENDDSAASLAVSDHRPIWVRMNVDRDDDGLRWPARMWRSLRELMD